MKTQHFVFLLVLVGLLVATPGPAFAQKIYWNGGQTIQRANLDGTGTEDLVDLNPSEIIRIALDQSHEKIYWSEYFAGLIRRANLDGTNVETVLGPTDLAGDFAIDEINGHIYWANGSMLGYYVSRSDLDGQNVQDVLYTNNFEAAAIDLDVAAGKIYLIFDVGYLMRANLDGSQAEVIHDDHGAAGIALALDLVNRKIYWSEITYGPQHSYGLFRSNLDGTEFEILPFPTADPIGVAVDPCNRRIYWSEWEGGQFLSISSASFDGTDPRSFSPVSAGEIELALPRYNPNGDPKCIPTLSTEMATLFAFLIICSGYFIYRRRVKEASCSRLAFALGAALLVTGSADIQPAQGSDPIAVFDVHESSFIIDSGWVSASGSGSEPVVIFSHTLEITDSPWLRLHFSAATLSGSRSAGNASFIRITGTQPGAVQTLDWIELQHWRGVPYLNFSSSTAYFNGDSVLIELLAYPNTGNNHITIDGSEDGSINNPNQNTDGLCDDSDDRAPAAEPRLARMRYRTQVAGGDWKMTLCTSFLVSRRPNVLLGAGHCNLNPGFDLGAKFAPLVEFNVPVSDADGNLLSPLPRDQYPIDQLSIHNLNASPNDGNDWLMFGVYPNWAAGVGVQHPIQRQHASFSLSPEVPVADGRALRVTGYGNHSTVPQYKWSPLSGTGPYTDKAGTIVEFRVDTLPGDSGAPVEHVCGDVYAINTDGLCVPTGANLGTAIDHPSLVDALTPNIDGGTGGTLEPKGVAADCNENQIDDWCDVDCRGTGSPCQVEGCGTKADCNDNDVPDECESLRDCNNNSLRDICEVYNNPLLDYNKNGVPDSCDISSQSSKDCNSNGTPDEWDICTELLPDCNTNFVPDACDIATGTSCDGDENGVPDECQNPIFVNGACCLSHEPTDCISTTQCDCDQQGIQFYGIGSKCKDVNCFLAPSGPQGP